MPNLISANQSKNNKPEFSIRNWQETMVRNEQLEEALMDTFAHLIGMTAAYETYVGRHDKCGMKDAFFETRLSDAKKAIDRARLVVEAS